MLGWRLLVIYTEAANCSTIYIYIIEGNQMILSRQLIFLWGWWTAPS